MTDAPASPAPRTSKTRYREAPKKKGPPIVLWIVVGAVLVVAAVWFFVVKADGNVRHRFPIAWPTARGGGEAVPVRHAVKPGDAFESTAKVRTGVVMGADHDPMKGMSFLATVRWTQTVAAGEGGAMRSAIVTKLDECTGTLPILGYVKSGLMATKPLTFELQRDATGRPVPGTGRVTPGLEDQRPSLDYCLSGLSDLTSSYLPPREVRVGDVWELSEAASIGGLVEMMRFLATVIKAPEGFPKGDLQGRLGAEALETKAGEPCVRLKLALQALCEGDVVAPARPGWISALAKVEGTVWVSTATGIVWALDTVAEGRATYDKGQAKEERRVRQFVEVTTKRVDPAADDAGR